MPYSNIDITPIPVLCHAFCRYCRANCEGATFSFGRIEIDDGRTDQNMHPDCVCCAEEARL